MTPEQKWVDHNLQPPEEKVIDAEREPVDKSFISCEPIYEGQQVIVTEFGYKAFPEEVNALIGEQLEMYSKDELIDVLEAFSGDGFEIWIKGKIIDYINIFKKQNRMKEVMEILQFEKVVAE